MSIAVELHELPMTTERYRWAYLLTVRDDATPHVVSLWPVWRGGELVMAVSHGTGRRAADAAQVTLCYPPVEPDAMSLVVDGTVRLTDVSDEDVSARTADSVIAFAAVSAVLHRAAPPPLGAE